MTDSGQSEQLPNNVEELQKECILLKKENSQLNCRLLGVNELARLLQDKSQSVDTLKDKNKRLELAVVRLENRCSNFEKKIKSQQQNAQVGEPTVPKVGTAPFIPGPSKQILESLMKENTELKKTIDGLTKKGPTSYREAVKMNQLEEIIDQKNETIELLRKQLDTMTSTGESESNSLQKQMLKMEQSMKVKDRFCTLLSERVNQLTRELEDSHKGTVGDYEGRGSFIEKVEIDSSLETVIKEHGIKEKNMRKMIGELQEQIEKERNEKKEALTQADETKQKLNEIQNDYESLENQFQNRTRELDELSEEKLSLSKQIENIKVVPKEIQEIKAQHQMEVDDKNLQIDQLKRLLEDAQYKYALAASEIVACKTDETKRTKDLRDKIEELEDEKEGLLSDISQLKIKERDLTFANMTLHANRHHYGGSSVTPAYFVMKTGGAPSLSLRDAPDLTVVKDSPKSYHDIIKESQVQREVPPVGFNSRGVETDSNTETTSSITSTLPPASTTEPSKMSAQQSSITSRTNYSGRLNTLPTPTTSSNQLSHPSSLTYQQQQQQALYQQHQMNEALSYQTHPSSNSFAYASPGEHYYRSGMPSHRSLPMTYTMQGSIPSAQTPQANNPHIYSPHVPSPSMSARPAQLGGVYYNPNPQYIPTSTHYDMSSGNSVFYTASGSYFYPSSSGPYGMSPSSNTTQGSSGGQNMQGGTIQRRPTPPNDPRYNNPNQPQ